MDSNAVFAILLLIVGLSILIAEVFIPSGGLLGVITFLTLIVSLIFAYKAWWHSSPNVFGVFCALLLVLVPTALSFGLYLLPRTALGKNVLLEAPRSQDLTPFSKESERLLNTVGQFGIAVTMLNPGGLVKVGGERLHAFSEGMTIESGTSIRITDVRGACVIVRAETLPDLEIREPEQPVDALTKKSRPLDFDFPDAD